MTPDRLLTKEGIEAVRGHELSDTSLSVGTWVAWTEGPAVDAAGNVYFTDLLGDRILVLTPLGERKVFREPSGRANGQVFDHDGILYHCEGGEFGPGGGRRITRTRLETGTYEVVTDRYDGRRYNSPNDICIDGQGRIFFTDPRYTDRADMEMELEGVYRIDLDGRVARVLAQPDVERPNGVAVSQDCRTLYVVDSSAAIGGNRKVWAFELDADGQPSGQEMLIDFGRGRGGDGMELDIEGNVYVAAGISLPRGPHESADVPTGIYVISPTAKLLGFIAIPEDPVTNLAFGGEDGRTLYVTAGKSLFVTRVDVPGQVAYPSFVRRELQLD